MGGVGSGRFGPGGEKRMLRVDECISLDIGSIRGKGCLVSREWHPEDPEASSLIFRSIRITDQNRKCVKLVLKIFDGTNPDQPPERFDISLKLVWTPCNLSGERPWFRCSGVDCGRHVRILYSPPGMKTFLCRNCWRLSFGSRQKSGDTYFQLIHRFDKTCRKMSKRGLPLNLMGNLPPRPKSMHRKTYNLLLMEQLRAIQMFMEGETFRLEKNAKLASRILTSVHCGDTLPNPSEYHGGLNPA